MKRILYSILTLFLILFIGCEKDNYDAPTSFLKGSVVFNGSPVGVRSNATQLELWQNTWDTRGVIARAKIAVYIAQDGSYSARLFDGNYKLVRLSGAPWAAQTDSIDVTVNGITTVDVPVTPNFSVTGETISYSGGVITSSCTVTKTGTLNIQDVTLYLGTTAIVDHTNNAQSQSLTGGAIANLSVPLNHSITLNTTLAARKYIYARIAVRTSGVTERNYSPVYKITIQ